MGVYLSVNEMKVKANRNSFHTRVKIYIETTMMPEDKISIKILVKTFSLLQPSVVTASNTSCGTFSKKTGN